MKTVAVFTEGQGELLFIRELLLLTIDNNDLSFECFELKASKQFPVPYKFESPTAKIHFILINVGNDEKVLSEIKNRCDSYTSRGVEIIGIRDMYSEAYKKRSNQIEQDVNILFQQSHQAIIDQMNRSNMIRLFFAIMELEAWFLAMYDVFERIDPSLTAENIRNQLGYDLEQNDPEISYFHPAINVEEILRLASKSYSKHQGEVLSIVSRITNNDIQNVLNINFCNNFIQLHTEIQRKYQVART